VDARGTERDPLFCRVTVGSNGTEEWSRFSGRDKNSLEPNEDLLKEEFRVGCVAKDGEGRDSGL